MPRLKRDIKPAARAAPAWMLPFLLLLALRAAGGDAPVRVYLDEQTAATVTASVQALVFARERTDLAVNARDYVSLVPIEVNRSGTRSYFWFGYVWSTIDRRSGESLVTQDDQLVLMADGRPIQLQATRQSMRELGIATAPLPRPGRAAVPVLFPASPDIVSFAGSAADLSLILVHDGLDQEFSLWRDGRQAVRNFSDHLGFEHR